MISESTRDQVVEKTIEVLQNHYAYPEKGEDIAGSIKERIQNGRYSDLDTISKFCSVLNQDLLEVSQDLHLAVLHSPEAVARYHERPA